jgi:hypothetical protein
MYKVVALWEKKGEGGGAAGRQGCGLAKRRRIQGLGNHIPFMVTVLLYETIVLGRPGCFRPVLPWRTRVTVFMPKTAAV